MQFKPIKQSFSIPYEYKLYFTKGIFNIENTLFKDIISAYKPGERIDLLFVIDKGVHKNHSDLTSSIKTYCNTYSDNLFHIESLIVQGGESSKNEYANVSSVLQAIDEGSICRHSFVVAIGGGAVIDMVGYAAAIAHRGVKLMRIPTTVLSQNDSAVGVKNGINIFKKKNFVGTFAPPYAIINDSNFLTTLEPRDWIAGIAEAVKIALIKDDTFFQYIRDHSRQLKNRDIEVMQYVIYRCAEMHMQHIAQGGDPFESGSSRPLDFGHWAAHKLEQMTNYNLRHGEAVAKGIGLDINYAYLKGIISRDILDRIMDVFENLGFDLHIPVNDDHQIDQLLKGINEFREHLGGKLTITLISEIGKKHDVHEIDMGVMKKAVHTLNERSKLYQMNFKMSLKK